MQNAGSVSACGRKNRKQDTYFWFFLARFGTGDAHQDMQIILSLGRAIVKTVPQTAGKSQESCHTQAAVGSLLHAEQRTALKALLARVARPLQARQRLDEAHPQLASALRESGPASSPDALSCRCHEVEGNASGLHKALGISAVVQEPAVYPTLPTPKILSAIKQIRSVDPPEMFLGGGAPSSLMSLRTRRTLPPHTGNHAIVCLDAFGSPRGFWRG